MRCIESSKQKITALVISLLLLLPALQITAAPFQKADWEVRGRVSDNNGPLAGASVTEKGGQNVAITKEDGTYTLRVSSSNATLVFSMIGYETHEEPVLGKHTVNAVLTQSSTELTGVVVTALGLTREKKSLGYSVGEISGKDMNRVVQENVLNAMAGKVAGVTISQTGGVGSSVSMVIRGATSLSSDNQPLFVVDGVPLVNTLNNVTEVGADNRVDFGNSISSINPDDIASVTILKGPSAAALYGSRAGNGVVLITTKNGSNVSKLTVSLTSGVIFDKPYRYLNWQTKYGAGIFSAIPVELSGNPLTDPFGGLIDEGAGGTGGGELDRGYKAIQWNSPIGPDGKKVPLPLVSHPNNMKNFVQTGVTTENAISVANNNQLFSYRLSYSNMTNKGIIPHSDLFRNALALNSVMRLTKNLKLSTQIDMSKNNSNNRPAGERGANPLQWVLATSPHIDIRDLKDYWLPGQEGLQQKTQYIGKFNNPYFLAAEVKNAFERNRLFGNIKADWQISKEFSLMARYGLDTYGEVREIKIPFSYTGEPRGAYGLINIKSLESNADFLATYKKQLSDLHLSVSAGGNTRFSRGSTLRNASKRGTGLIVPEVYTVQNILPANLDYNSYFFKKGINSLYAMMGLNYKEMIFLDLTGRNDWSSTLPKAQPYFYPSASLSLLVNEIAGIKSDKVNLIKLRGGFAQVGNDASPYQLLSVLGNAGTWTDVPRLTTSGVLLNSELKPELATSYEAGIEIALFKNRLNFSGTVYRIDNENQIFSTQLPSSSGYTNKNINAGLLRSRGLELTLGGTPVKTRDLRWDVNLNFSRNRTKVVKLAEEMPYFTFWEDAKGGAWTYVGEDVGDIYGPSLRVVEDKSSPYYGYPLLEFEDGGAKWSAVSARNTRNKIGNFNPDFIMGFQTGVSWKNWSFNVTLDWRNGGDFVSQTYRYGMEDGQAALQFRQFFDAGSMSGKELRDYLVAHQDELIIVNGNQFPRVGWPTPERTSYPFDASGYKLPYGGLFIPGVYAKGFDANGKPTGYIENLGENILGADKNNPNATLPVPYAASNPWDFMQASLFPASYLKLREVALSYSLPQSWMQRVKMQNASLSVYSRNIVLWTAAKIGVDPENAYQPSTGVTGGGIQFLQGIERYNVTPWVTPIGVRLNLVF